MSAAFGGALLSLDTAGVLVKRLWPAGVGFGLAAKGGTLYGASDYPSDSLWKRPLGSSTPPVGTLMGDPSGDGLVTSMDTLIILSSVVQKDVSAFCVGIRR